VQIMPAESKNCSFHLKEGWNLVSFFCLSNSVSTRYALESLNGSYDKIFSYASTDSVDPWKSYNPSLPDWAVQQLEYVSRIPGYWIYINNETDYIYVGYEKYTFVPLYPGWNLVGYASLTNHTINDSLFDIQFTTIKTYDTFTGVYPIYIVNATNNTLEYLETYKGYWINSSASQNWIVYK
jgi:hypothetical protein